MFEQLIEQQDAAMALAVLRGANAYLWCERAMKPRPIRVDDAGGGCDRSLRARRNRRWTATASRSTDSRKSMVAPVESMAR